MGERRRLADDLVGVPRWGRLLAYGVLCVMGIFSVVAAVGFLPWFGYRLMGGLPALIVMVAFEIAVVVYLVALQRSPRVRHWYSGRDDGKLVIDFSQWKHWDRFMRLTATAAGRRTARGGSASPGGTR